MARVFLGPFEVFEPIGEGGMGKVFRGTHVETGSQVAVKVIAGRIDQALRDHFQREVQAQAKLVDPGIVYLFDYGEIHELTAKASEGRLTAKSPYAVMEYTALGTLKEYLPLLSWDESREVLIQVLKALAYAHARGVIHRDLKPENLLIFPGRRKNERRIKVTDFGVAHLIREEQDLDLKNLSGVAGTLQYMSPEQIHGKWRSYGPWTDLYALGCIAWEIVSGKFAFQGKNIIELASLHLEGERPPLEPLFELPSGVEEWIHRAIAIDAGDRFQSAAEAVRALPPASSSKINGLKNLRDESLPTTLDWATTTVETSSNDLGATLLLDESSTLISSPDELTHLSPQTDSQSTKARSDEIDIPTTWRTHARVRSALPQNLIGAGLPLFGLREIPFNGRDEERDRIWTTFYDAATTEKTAILLVTGEAGAGKSRLLEWIGTQVLELGAGEVHSVRNFSSGGILSGLSGLLLRTFRAWEMPREAFFKHLLRELPPLSDDKHRHDDARALTELVFPSADSQTNGTNYLFGSPSEKYALVARLLDRFLEQRPLLLKVDDLHDDEESLGFVEYLARKRGARRLLVIASLRSEVLATNTALNDRLTELRTKPCVDVLSITPLGRQEHRELINGMLHLDPELTTMLGKRTEGNPLFAQQVLGHWIEAQLLEVGRQGFRLIEGGENAVPGEVRHVFMHRIREVLARVDEKERLEASLALQMAAALGRVVNNEEVETLGHKLGVGLKKEVVEAMIAQGLASRERGGWSFAHPLLLEILEEEARVMERWEMIHRQCAHALMTIYKGRLHHVESRLARHFLHAQRFEEAFEAGKSATEKRLFSGDPTGASEMLDIASEALTALQEEPASQRWDEVEILKLHLYEKRLKPWKTRTQAERLLQRSEETGHWKSRVAALNALGDRSWADYENGEEATSYFQEALHTLKQHQNDRHLRARTLQGIATVQYGVGDLTGARQSLERILEIFNDARGRDASMVMETLINLARVAFREGRHKEAKVWFEQAREIAQAQGNSQALLNIVTGLGDVSMLQENYVQAERSFRRSLELINQLEIGGVTIGRINLGMALLGLNRYDEAREMFLLSAPLIRENQIYRVQAALELSLGICEASEGAWDEAENFFDDAIHCLDRSEVVIPDTAILLEKLASLAIQAHRKSLASRSLERARQIWQKLDNQQALTRVKETEEHLRL